jgi:acetylornithine deacetylase
VTVCAAGDRHNVIPAEARYTVDIRSTPGWSHDALAARIRGAVSGEVAVRSERFRPVATPPGAGVLAAARRARPGARTFASPTLSDWAHLSCPAIKWGPGMSEVSHTADEWVELATVDEAVGAYRRAIEAVLA